MSEEKYVALDTLDPETRQRLKWQWEYEHRLFCALYDARETARGDGDWWEVQDYPMTCERVFRGAASEVRVDMMKVMDEARP